MFNMASRRIDVVSMAYALRIGLLLVLWVWWYTAFGMEIGLQSEPRAIVVDSRHPESSGLPGYSMGTTADRDLHTDQSRVAGAHDNRLQSYRPFIVAPDLRSEIRDRLMRAAGRHMNKNPGRATRYRHGGEFVKDSNLWHESIVNSNTRQCCISNFDFWKSQPLGGAGYDLTNPKRYPHSTRFFKSSQNSFTVETVYEKTVTHGSWLDHYAKSVHEMANTNQHHFDALLPPMEYIDKSLTAVYRPEGKKISLRYEDQKGGSLFSEITVFF